MKRMISEKAMLRRDDNSAEHDQLFTWICSASTLDVAYIPGKLYPNVICLCKVFITGYFQKVVMSCMRNSVLNW